MDYELPKNCWLSPEATPHPVPHGQHGNTAEGLLSRLDEAIPDDAEYTFHRLYDLGWARVQWENPTRINVAFKFLTFRTREFLQDLIDFFLHSDVSILVCSPEGREDLKPGDRRWRQKLNNLNHNPEQDTVATGGPKGSREV